MKLVLPNSSHFAIATSLLVGAAMLGACTVSDVSESSETTQPVYFDTDSDGAFDAVDVDGDGVPDYGIEPGNAPQPFAFNPDCPDILADLDGDGNPEGIDFNCDGVIDIPFTDLPDPGDGDGANTSQCSSSVSINGESQAIECSSDGGPYECSCSIDGEVVSTCTTDSSQACSIPGPNCCGF